MNTNTSIRPDKPGEDKLAKKVYQSPELVLYGNISEITRAVGNMGMMDGASSSPDKTET
jgi:hypothetical protein